VRSDTDSSSHAVERWSADVVARVLGELETVGQLGTCLKRKVGAAVLSRDGYLLASAPNGTPPGMKPCNQGGCVRCSSSGFPHGTGYDLCICLHAEQAVLLAAHAAGLEVRGQYVATGYQPCFMCAKLIVGAGFAGVLYIEPWIVPGSDPRLPGLQENYGAFWDQLPDGCARMPSGK
jgi:dCMP deaminase